MKLQMGCPSHERPDVEEKEDIKNVAGTTIRSLLRHHGKPLKVLASDEACFGLINCHQRRCCLEGFRPPRSLCRIYKLYL